MLNSFNLLCEEVKTTIISEAAKDLYHFTRDNKLMEIRNVKFEDFDSVMNKIKEDGECKVTSPKKNIYKFYVKDKNEDGWSLFNSLNKKYKDLKQFQPQVFGSYIMYSWPESVSSKNVFYLGKQETAE